jgi:hypothetical protein
MSRPFNQKAYDAFDFKNKTEIVSIMSKKGYTLVGKIKEEHYKKYDVKFIKDGKELSFENETRINFQKIKDVFLTIHIPIRKQNTQADYYIVWKPEMDEFFLISKDVINEHKKETVTLICNEYDEDNSYEDSFIDIPKDKADLYRKINNNWKIVKN